MAHIGKAGHGEQAVMFIIWIGIKTFSSMQQIKETLSNNYRNENYWSIRGGRETGYIMRLAAEVFKGGDGIHFIFSLIY